MSQGPADADHGSWLLRAVALATRSVDAGGGPFGALIVRDGTLLAEGSNRVTLDRDPTAHAEVSAIRGACRIVNDYRLHGAVLYASCEPCPMCQAAAAWARLDRIYFAAPGRAAAAAGFDDLELVLDSQRPGPERNLPTLQLPVPGAEGPLLAWRAREDRIPY